MDRQADHLDDTADTAQDPEALRARVTPLVGQTAWGPALGIGSFVTVEFGDTVWSPPTTPAAQPIHGAWHLWVMHSAWRLEAGDAVLAASEDPRPALAEAVRRLNGRTLRAIDLRDPGTDTVLHFGGNGGNRDDTNDTIGPVVTLRLFSVHSDRSDGDYEHWQLFCPDGHVLVVGPGSRWSVRSAAAAGSPDATGAAPAWGGLLARPLTEVQRLNLDLLSHAGFDAFDGRRVAADLLAHRELWDAALVEQRGFAGLFALPAGYWPGDTLYLLPSADRPGAAQDLEALARTWHADEVTWTHPDDFQLDRRAARRVLRLWWD